MVFCLTILMLVIRVTPLKYNLEDEHFYFPFVRGRLLTFPEMLSHYLLLYNLSMIARYETEWWSELLKTMPNKDYPFIVQFLNLTAFFSLSIFIKSI